jgi:hypothetical protein
VLLGDEDDGVRVAACNSLMSLAFWLEDLEAKNRLSIALVFSLEDGLEAVRAAAAETLGYLGIVDDDGLRSLHVRLKDQAQSVVIAACAALGSIADPRSVDELRELLESTDPLIRWNAVTSLGKINFADKVILLRKMSREDETVREAANGSAQPRPPCRAAVGDRRRYFTLPPIFHEPADVSPKRRTSPSPRGPRAPRRACGRRRCSSRWSRGRSCR